jgi:hypothetical protein
VKRKDLLGIQELDGNEILEILDTAETLQGDFVVPSKVPTLRANSHQSFFEPPPEPAHRLRLQKRLLRT